MSTAVIGYPGYIARSDRNPDDVVGLRRKLLQSLGFYPIFIFVFLKIRWLRKINKHTVYRRIRILLRMGYGQKNPLFAVEGIKVKRYQKSDRIPLRYSFLLKNAIPGNVRYSVGVKLAHWIRFV